MVTLAPPARGARAIAALVLALSLAAACAREDWGGPKGPPPAPPDAAAPAPPPPPPGTPVLSSPTAITDPPSGSAARRDPAAVLPRGDGGVPLTPRIEAQLSGGKIPGFDDAIAGMRPSLKACVEGRGEADAVVELSAPIDARGRVGRVDTLGGSQLGPGAVACLVKRVEEASFKKPASGAPRLLLRVKLRRE